jgi:hypothetical protein
MSLRRAVTLAALCLLVGPGVRLSFGECPVAVDAMENRHVEFEGQLGGKRVRLYLGVDWPHEERINGRVNGLGASGESPRLLSGGIAPDCVVTVDELDRQPRGSWTLRFESASRLTGRRVEPGSTPVVVRFRAVPAPSCDGREPWRRFRSAAWPITFDYPASWRIELARDGDIERLGLTCPSLASQLLQRDGFELYAGRGDGRKPANGQPLRTVGSFFTLDGVRWIAGDVDSCREKADESVFCSRARQSTVAGMKILQGYLADARRGSLHYAFLLPDHWVELVSYGGALDTEGEGPVVYGDDVLSRVVRTIRPASATP